MPYIKQEDRDLIDPVINKIMKEILLYEGDTKVYSTYGMIKNCFTKLEVEEDFDGDEFTTEFYNLFKEEYNKKDIRVLGKLNYFVSKICWAAVEGEGYGIRCLMSAHLHELITYFRGIFFLYAVLNDVVLELYRRKTAEYEDNKIIENGDI